MERKGVSATEQCNQINQKIDRIVYRVTFAGFPLNMHLMAVRFEVRSELR